MSNAGQKAGIGLIGCGCSIVVLGLLMPVITLIICVIIGAMDS